MKRGHIWAVSSQVAKGAVRVRGAPRLFLRNNPEHRHGAAKRAGLTEVPCWVREMDDDEAFMQLILSNTQGEMSPLEEGHHVAKYAERSTVGGRGNKGGLSNYARRLNKKESTLRFYRDAYRVYEKVAGAAGINAAKMGHTTFHEISKAPEGAWIPLVSAWKETWTVKETARKVSEIQRFDIPEQHTPWLPVDRVTAAYLRDERPTPSAVERLITEADRVLDAIAENGTTEDAAEFRAWRAVPSGCAGRRATRGGGPHADGGAVRVCGAPSCSRSGGAPAGCRRGHGPASYTAGPPGQQTQRHGSCSGGWRVPGRCGAL